MSEYEGRLVTLAAQKFTGSYATADMPAGSQVIPVYECSAFNDEEDGGGFLRLRFSDDADPETPAVDVIVAYSDAGGPDGEDDVVTLAEPYPSTIPAGTNLDVWDPAKSKADVYYAAEFLPDDAEPDAEPLEAIVHGDLMDTLTPETLPGPGERVMLREDEVDGPIYITRVIGGQLDRTIAYSSEAMTTAAVAANADMVAESAEERGTGLKPANPQTATSGPRVGLAQRGGRGYVDFYGNDSRRAAISVLSEEARQVMQMSSDVDSLAAASRVVLRSGDGQERSVSIFTDMFEAFAPFMARQGVVLPRGPARLLGFDAGIVNRTTPDGKVTINHTVGTEPVAFAWLIGGHFAYYAGVVAAGASSITVDIRNRTDRELATGATVDLGFVAIAISRTGA